MERLDACEADEAIELAEGPLVAVLRAQIVAGCEQVAGVQTNTYTTRSLHAIEDGREMFETATEIGALSRCLLQQHRRSSARPRAEQAAERVGDERQPALFGPARVRARMHDEPVETQRFGTIELLAEGGNRLRSQVGGRGRHVDQVAVVRDDRTDAGLGDPRAKTCDLFGRKRTGAPLA